MKKVNWDNTRIRNLVDHETPFAVINTPEHCIKLWWTKGGAHGPQVMAIVYYFGDDGDTWKEFPVVGRSSGYGLCKTTAALEMCFRYLGKGPRGFGDESDIREYRIGGNYHRVPRRDWLKYS